jgi:ferredoxin
MNNMNEFYASILHNVREEAKKEERERILAALRDMHIEKRQLAHINTPSGVCGTCRAVAIAQGENK